MKKFLSIELNQSSVKYKTTTSLFFLAHFFLFLLQNFLSECVQMKGSASLFIFLTWIDLEPSRIDLSNWQGRLI